MALYKTIQTLDFKIDPEICQELEVFSLSIPVQWMDQFKGIMPKSQNAPVQTLAQAVRFLIPDILYIEEWNKVKRGWPWLIARQPVEPLMIVLIFKAWLENGCIRLSRSLHESDLQLISERLDANDLSWKRERLNLTEISTHPNGTANHNNTYFNAIPGILVELLSQPNVAISVNDKVLHFRQSYNSRSPELISWRPQCNEIRSTNWYWSFVLKPVVHTLPFVPYPMLRFIASIRRWVSHSLAESRDKNKEYINLPLHENTTVYVASDSPWMNIGVAPKRMTGISIGLESEQCKFSGERKFVPTWKSQLDLILKNIPKCSQLPSPQELVRNPAGFLNDDIRPAAIAYRPKLRYSHQVQVGVPAQDRRDIYNGLSQLLETHGIVKTPQWTRQKIRPGKRSFLTEPTDKVPPCVVCSLVKNRIGDKIRFEVLVQSLETGNKLCTRIGKVFGLDLDVEASLGMTEYHSNGLTVEIHVGYTDAIAATLTTNTGDIVTRREERLAAARRHSEYVAKEMGIPNIPTVTLVELDNLTNRWDDPKEAIRWGLAKANRVSQFITPDNEEDNEDESDEEKTTFEHKIKSSVSDALRQWGLLPGSLLDCLPESTGIPKNLQVLGFWIIDLGSQNGDKLAIPLALRIDHEGKVTTKIHEEEQWMPYPTTLIALAQRQMELGIKKKYISRFFRSIMAECSIIGPTLVLCHSQNVRNTWKWIADKYLVKDQLQWSDKLPLGTFEGLRLVRVRNDGSYSETPQWFAQKEDESVGIASGIFNGEDDRTFFSLQAKPLSMKAPINESKLIRPNRHHSMPTIKEILSAVLEPGDSPTEWAGFIHRLRKMAFHHDEAFEFPLPLHLASKMEEYARLRQKAGKIPPRRRR